MKITIEQLRDLRACPDGLVWYQAQKTEDLVSLVKAAISGGARTMEYANWGIVRFMTNGQKIRYAVFAARQVLKIYEDKYPGDNRPRAAIDAAERYLINPSDAARAAAYAARARLLAKILRYGVKLIYAADKGE